MSTEMFTGIVDIHHDDGSYDLDEVVAGGVTALWHKATEGVTFHDPKFVRAMDGARAAPLSANQQGWRGPIGVEVAADAGVRVSRPRSSGPSRPLAPSERAARRVAGPPTGAAGAAEGGANPSEPRGNRAGPR